MVYCHSVLLTATIDHANVPTLGALSSRRCCVTPRGGIEGEADSITFVIGGSGAWEAELCRHVADFCFPFLLAFAFSVPFCWAVALVVLCLGCC